MSPAERVVITEVMGLQARLTNAVQACRWDEAEDLSLQVTSVLATIIGIIHARKCNESLVDKARRLGISLDEQHPLLAEKLMFDDAQLDEEPTRKALWEARGDASLRTDINIIRK